MKKTIKIPLQILTLNEEGYHVFVKGKANDQQIRLLLDTGASRTVFDYSSLQKIHSTIEMEENEDMAVGLGSTEIKNFLALIDDFCLGNCSFGEVKIGVLDLTHVNDSYSKINLPVITGVLGSDLLVKYNAVINYEKKQLVLKVEDPANPE